MKTLEQIKVTAAVEALAANGFNQVKAAKALGISRGTLRTLAERYLGESLIKEVFVKKYLDNKRLPESSL